MRKFLTFSIVFFLCVATYAQTRLSLIATHYGTDVSVNNHRSVGGTQGDYYRNIAITGDSQPNGLGKNLFDVEFGLTGFEPFTAESLTVDLVLTSPVPVIPGGILFIGFMNGQDQQVLSGTIVLDSLSSVLWKRFTIPMSVSIPIHKVSFIILSSQEENSFFVNASFGVDNIVIKKPTGDILLASFEEEDVVSVEKQELPAEFVLLQNYPNPFNPTTVIKFSSDKIQKVSLKIYDVLGKEVATLLNEERSAGVHTIHFDGSGLSSGTYFYILNAGGKIATKKMLLLK